LSEAIDREDKDGGEDVGKLVLLLKFIVMVIKILLYIRWRWCEIFVFGMLGLRKSLSMGSFIRSIGDTTGVDTGTSK
jgi:hypothetical protein